MKEKHGQNIIDLIEFGATSLLRRVLAPETPEEAQRILNKVPLDKRNDLWHLLSIDYGTYKKE